LPLDRHAPVKRKVDPPEHGTVIATSQVGGLHRRYRRAAWVWIQVIRLAPGRQLCAPARQLARIRIDGGAWDLRRNRCPVRSYSELAAGRGLHRSGWSFRLGHRLTQLPADLPDTPVGDLDQWLAALSSIQSGTYPGDLSRFRGPVEPTQSR